MPLDPEVIRTVTAYYRKKLGYYTNFIDKFDFLSDKKLQERLAQEYYIAKYIAGIQDAMNFDDNSFELLGHLKFQIVQYAGIFEAVISHLLIHNFGEDTKVLNLQKKIEYKPVDALSNGTEITHNKNTIHMCVKSEKKLAWSTNNIRFDEKLKVAKKIGFVDDKVGSIISEIYGLRHAIHPEKAVKDEVVFQKEQVRLASDTMNVFLSDVKKFLAQ